MDTLGSGRSDGEHAAGRAWSDSLMADIRGIAGRWRGLGRESLRPTVLMHESFIRLRAYHAPAKGDDKAARTRYLALVKRAVRSIAVDSLRRKRACGPLDETRAACSADPERGGELSSAESVGSAVRAALSELAAVDERKARVAELRWLMGLSVAQAAASLGVSERTIELDSQRARAWLNRRLSERQ